MRYASENILIYKTEQAMKIVCFKFFLGIHCFFILLGSGLFQFKSKLMDRLIGQYAGWTGGGFGYSFFSPDVGNQVIVKTFTLLPNEALKEDIIGTGTDMFDSRFSAVLHTFRNEKAYELMSRVAVSYMVAKYPGAHRVYVAIGEYEAPSITAYRKERRSSHFREICSGIYVY